MKSFVISIIELIITLQSSSCSFPCSRPITILKKPKYATRHNPIDHFLDQPIKSFIVKSFGKGIAKKETNYQN